MKRISIRDIAKQAGVVPSTVSFVLNGKAKQMRISDRVAEKIRAIALETGYTPHHTAVSLRTGRSNILGLIVEDISNVFFATLARIIEEEAYASGYKIVYCSTENDDTKGKELIKMLMNQQVDGFLITPSPGMKDEIDKLVKGDKCVVLMDRYFSESDIPFILVDNFGGVKIGMEHLIEKGYRNIAFITVDLDQIQMRERLRGYKETLKENNLSQNDDMILEISYVRKDSEAVQLISEFIKKLPAVDAVFFATNYLGISGLESIKNLKLKIPEDLAVLCFDDHDIFRLFTPSITIIQQPVEEIARTAVQLLVKQIGHNRINREDLQLFLKPKLVLREST